MPTLFVGTKTIVKINVDNQLKKLLNMDNQVEQLLKHISSLPPEDISTIVDFANYYISCNNNLKELLRKDKEDALQLMAGAGFLSRKLLGSYGKAIITQSTSGIFASDPEDYGVGWVLRRDGVFGAEQLRMISPLLSKDSNALVVGAHIGTLAIPLAKMCKSVVAVEANPKSFSLLQMNIKLNDILNCEVFNIAANDKDEDICFMMSKSNSGGSKRKPLVDQYIYNYDHPDEVTIRGATLDKFFLRRDFDLVLMDIEGSEYFALQGMQDILRHVSTVVIEFIPHHLRNISGVSVDSFLTALSEFTTMTVPRLKKIVGKAEFSELLSYMYDNEIEEGGIIFTKN